MRSASVGSLGISLSLVCLLTTACPPAPQVPPTLTGEALRDPTTCQACHAEAVSTWQQSGHARATTAPLFVASLAAVEREQGSESVAACLTCHAPFAQNATVAELTALPARDRGVTCFACHGVEDIEGEHDGQLRFQSPDAATLLGRATAPSATPAHHLMPSALLDRTRAKSTSLCVSCHQSEGANAVLETTGEQHAASIFSDATTGTSCAGCHINRSDHAFGSGAAENTMRALDTVVSPELCVEAIGGGVEVTVRLENFGSSHRFPTGGSHRKRAWVEVVATLGAATLFSIGDFADETSVDTAAEADPELWTLHGELEDAAGDRVLFPWNAAAVTDKGLLPATGLEPNDPAYEDVHQVRTYFFVGPTPDRVQMRVRYKDVAIDVVNALETIGDLEPGTVSTAATTLAGTAIAWTPDVGRRCVPAPRR